MEERGEREREKERGGNQLYNKKAKTNPKNYPQSKLADAINYPDEEFSAFVFFKEGRTTLSVGLSVYHSTFNHLFVFRGFHYQFTIISMFIRKLFIVYLCAIIVCVPPRIIV